MNHTGKPKGMYYLYHQAVNTDHGIIVGVVATSSDVNDSAPFLDLMEKVRETVKNLAITADAVYNFLLTYRVLRDHKINFFVRQ